MVIASWRNEREDGHGIGWRKRTEEDYDGDDDDNDGDDDAAADDGDDDNDEDRRDDDVVNKVAWGKRRDDARLYETRLD